MISRYRSPRPRISVCCSSALYSCWNVGSSSCSLCRPFDSFSSSPRCFTSIATVMTGSGNGILRSTIGASRVDSVSFVCVSRSFATTLMSPACSSAISKRSFPTLTHRWFSFSTADRGALYTSCPLHRAGVDAEVGHVSHMRLGHRLEHLRDEWTAVLRPQRDALGAAPLLGLHCGTLVGRGKELDHLGQEGARPVGQLRRAAEQREHLALRHPRLHGGDRLVSPDLLAAQVALEQRIVGLGDALD